MDGNFGVFDGVELLAEFGDDEAAEDYRRDLLQLDLPEHLRAPLYDDLEVREVPDDPDFIALGAFVSALNASRNRDLAIARCLRRLREAQHVRAEARRAAA